MTYSLDIDGEYKSARAVILRYSLIFSLLLSLTILGDVLLVIFSKDDYLINQIISIVISILFSWYAIFFFTTIYKKINEKYRYFKNYESGIKEEAEVIYLDIKDELTYINGLYAYPLRVKYLIGIESEEKTIYTTKKDLGYVEGDKLSISTYQRILIKAEKHL